MMTCRCAIAMFSVLPTLCLAAEPATAPADSADPFVSRAAGTPAPAAPVRPDALVRFSVTDGLLVVQTTLPPCNDKVYALPPLQTQARVTIRHHAAPTEPYTPDALQIETIEQAGEQQSRQSLFAAANTLNLSREMENGGRAFTIQYIQSAQASMSGQAATLYLQSITDTGESGGKATPYAAADFPEFIRRYPTETSRYLRPIIEAYGPQPKLFMVDDALAASVFPEAFKVDDATRDRVISLVKQLDADSFRQRQDAGDALQKMGTPAATVLATLDRNTLTPEQAARIEAILASAQPTFKFDARKLREDKSFLLDCLMSDNRSIRVAALAALNKAIGAPVAFADTPDAESRIREVYKLREKLLPAAATTQPLPRPSAVPSRP